MGRPKKKHHKPGKRKRSGRWRIYWRGPDGKYEMSLGEVSEAEAEKKRLEVDLALRTGEWPDWAASRSPVRRYRQGRGGGTGDLLSAYEEPLRAEVSEDWATASLAYVRELRDWSGKSLAEVTPADAVEFLEHVLQTPPPYRGKNQPDEEREPRTRATRNRMLAACRRFYGWAAQKGIVQSNPFDGVSQISEPEGQEIVYCTRGERDRILEAAGREGQGLAVWIAFYAGMRRGEIWKARWEDVLLERQRIRVPTSKTKRPRVIPLAAELEEVLREAVPGQDYVIPRENTWKHEARQLRKELRRKVGADIPDERIRWNAWRHTFGSLLAQQGVSLDKISSWMGNSPTICRRHYAQFVPRDRHDEDIERL